MIRGPLAGGAAGLFGRQLRLWSGTSWPPSCLTPGCIFREATYLAWVDLSRCLPDVEDLPGFFANEAGVLLEGRRRLVCGQRPRLCPAEPGHAQIRPPHRLGADAGCHPPPSFLREARPRSQVLLSPPEAAPGPWPGTPAACRRRPAPQGRPKTEKGGASGCLPSVMYTMPLAAFSGSGRPPAAQASPRELCGQ